MIYFDLPTNERVERLVLGCIILDDSILPDIRGVLTPEDFGSVQHQRIWRRVAEMFDCGQHVDYVTLAAALKEAGELESVGNISYLAGLNDGVPQLPSVEEFVRILKDDTFRRNLITAADGLAKRAVNRDKPSELLKALAALPVDLAPKTSGRGPISVRQLVETLGVSEILSPRTKRGFQFPWAWMNRVTGGMLPGELWVAGGHTGTGKSSAAIQIAANVARQHDKTTVIFSLEMGDVSVAQRAVWQISRVDSELAKRGALDMDSRERAMKALTVLSELPLMFDSSSFSVMDISANLRRLRAQGPIGFVVVDYLQLLRDGGRHNTRAEAVGANARVLKLLADEFECPVLVLSQLSRESARTRGNEPTRRPELFDLKESGDIENHANGVLLLHRPCPEDADRIPVEFILAKQRDGRRNIMQEFVFFPKFQRFSSMDGEDE